MDHGFRFGVLVSIGTLAAQSYWAHRQLQRQSLSQDSE